jgi:hypothetical protein
VKITVVSMGQESAQQAIKQVLAMGADEGVLLNDPAFADGDSHTTAKVLAAAIKSWATWTRSSAAARRPTGTWARWACSSPRTSAGPSPSSRRGGVLTTAS